jgi:hypothetical protein
VVRVEAVKGVIFLLIDIEIENIYWTHKAATKGKPSPEAVSGPPERIGMGVNERHNDQTHHQAIQSTLEDVLPES